MKIVILIFIFFFSVVIQSQNINSNEIVKTEINTVSRKLDSLIKITKDNQKTNTKTVLEIKDSETIFKKEKSDWWEKYSSGLIALLTIIISARISYKLASNESKKQEEITRQQINAQLAIAQDQIAQNREQMQESSRITLLQVRNNNISAARIEWIQKLRPLLAELISKTSDFDNSFSELDKLIEIKTPTNDDRIKVVKLQEKLEKNADDCDNLWNQILLFLNKNEKEHQELITSFSQLSENIGNKIDSKPLIREVTEEELIDKAKAVLKTAWEQAKNIN